MRALIVEDNVPLAEGLAKGLNREGFDVDVRHDGNAGLDAALIGLYDVIILDVMLPGMTGHEVCTSLRAGGETVPILMLTARDEDHDVITGLGLGADDYVTKPFSLPVLVAHIHALVRRTNRNPVNDELHAGAVVLDPTTHTCTVDGAPVSLTRREFALLELLTRNAGTPLSKQRISEGVWGIDRTGDSNVVEVYIGYLRRKLGRHAKNLETVRGVGYRLVEQ